MKKLALLKLQLKSQSFSSGKKTAAVFYYRTDDASVRPYLQRFARQYNKLQNFFKVTPPPLDIRFIYTRAEMSLHWGRPAPRWLSGMVDNDNQYLIYIYSPLVIAMLTTEQRSVIMPTIVHETAHAFVTALNERCFYWINEGICQCLEGKKSSDSPVTKKNWHWFTAHNGLIDPNLSWCKTVNHDGYAIAHCLAAFILKTRGKQAILQLIKIRRVSDPAITQKIEQIVGQPLPLFLTRFEKTVFKNKKQFEK
jgi:hypothetical protein